MYRSAYDLKAFYNDRAGRVIQTILQDRILEFWPACRNMRIMGLGYATPYLLPYLGQAERVFAVMPAAQGAHAWPAGSNSVEGRNLVCLAEESELPIENSSIDRMIIMHHLEFSELLQSSLQEVWRVLKPSGRILMIVPNRAGFWARADWSPFGQGTPYSAAQIQLFLRDNLFVHERSERALFMPPLICAPVLNAAGVIERIGRRFLPFGAGVHMIEASKQLYARSDPGAGSRVHVRGRVFMPRPVPQT